ncbi:hypothetical protein ACWGDX_13420 [Streptomyces sp. NPDC055025]
MTTQPEPYTYTYTDPDGDTLSIRRTVTIDGSAIPAVSISARERDSAAGVMIPVADVERVVAAIRTAAGQPADRAALREHIAEAFARYDWNVAPVFRSVNPNADHYGLADAVLAVLPEPAADRGADQTAEIERLRTEHATWRKLGRRNLERAHEENARLRTDRAAVLREAIAAVEDPQQRARTTTGLGLGWEAARDVLLRMAAEAQQPTAEERSKPVNPAALVEVRDRCPHCRDQQLVPRRQMAEHLARLHPDQATAVEQPDTRSSPATEPTPAELIRDQVREWQKDCVWLDVDGSPLVLPGSWPDAQSLIDAIRTAVVEECRDGGDGSQPDARRERYVAAVLAALARDTTNGPNWGAAADAAMAVADEEQRELRAELHESRALASRRESELIGRRATIKSLRAELEQARAERAVLAPMLDGLARLVATNSRDWGTDRVDAWLWAVICGWDCEEAEHTDTCTHGAMEEMAARHGWDEETVAKARRYRAVVRTVEESGPVSKGGAREPHGGA